MNRILQHFELPLVLLLFLAGAAFLLKMCYLSLLINTLFGLTFLTAVALYVYFRHALKLPISLLFLVFAALQIDALGNFFRLYGRSLGPIQYDELSHLCVQILVTPPITWLVKRALEALGHSLPQFLSTFFASTVIFSLSAFYEIIELWDELYFGGQRIWSSHDTATDLQWDLVGIFIGGVLSFLILPARTAQPEAKLSAGQDCKHSLTPVEISMHKSGALR